MRRIILLLICLVMGLALPGTGTAVADGGLYNGLTSDGYVYQDGLWYQGQQAFVRTKQPFTYYNGYQQCQSYRYVYEPAPENLVGEPIEEWRRELLALKASRDKWESELKASQEEQKEFLETVKSLGLEDYYNTDTSYPSPLNQAPQYQNAYGGMEGYDLQGKTTTYRAPLAAQGNTLFGYDQYAQSYPDVDLQVLYNQANSLAESAQRLTSDATADFSALVYQEGKRQEEIAKIVAKGKVAAQVLQMLQDPRSELKIDEWQLRRQSQKEGGNWEVIPRDEQYPAVPPQPQPQDPNDELDGGVNMPEEQRRMLFGVIANNCMKCHGPGNKKAGLDMTKFLSLDIETRQAIVQTLTAEDPDIRMPKGPGGSPGEPLMDDEIDLFYAAAGLSRTE